MPSPHDLLFLHLPDRFSTGGAEGWPAWLDAAWLAQAPLVVRREAAPAGLLPVGARGLTRSQRCKGYVQHDAVARCVTPEMLARQVLGTAGAAPGAPGVPAPASATGPSAWSFPPALPAPAPPPSPPSPGGWFALPPLQALAAMAPTLAQLGLAWGPTGGAGFQLASGLTVLRADSDLDLLVRAPAVLAPSTIDRLLRLQERQASRVDIQVDTGVGGFALNEYARGGRVLLKTAHGPLLLADPWQPGAAQGAAA
ncbi:hypothetical protein ASF61_15815 [Duganella sp. Leaf126]|uniref:malonate decarboxylase holo-ACP synthase n=1 Tax=Duganella sp. Leaf126 TaxID=1736266 RepID=UPI0006F564BA|nr:malonate decarboxylase holo-ACP synthase [Duganella sp. Leaf126]KQQ32488.1 hypothetical protein ASF61_15815 [Duganella sp. Leaf126]